MASSLAEKKLGVLKELKRAVSRRVPDFGRLSLIAGDSLSAVAGGLLGF